MALSIVAISMGAALGAVLRWILGMKLDALSPAIPAGTLASNLVGGFAIGAALAFFAASPGTRPEWRLFLVTGFCGGLTTFSTFSAEVVTLLRAQRPGWAMAAISVHVVGSLLATFAGLIVAQRILQK